MGGLRFRVSGSTSMRNKFIVMCCSYMPWISQSSLKVGEIVELTTRPLDHQWILIHIIQLWASKQKWWNMDYWTPSANIIRLFYAAKVVNRKVTKKEKVVSWPLLQNVQSCRGRGKRLSFSSALCCFAPITRVAGKPWNRSIKGSYVWVQLFRKGFPNKKYTGLFKDAYRWLYTLQIPLTNNFHKHLLVQIIENLSSGGARGGEESLLEEILNRISNLQSNKNHPLKVLQTFCRIWGGS